MKNRQLSLIIKIAAIVFLAFALVLGNEISLGIDRYKTNTIDSNTSSVITYLDEFARQYNDIKTNNKKDLKSDEFRRIYDRLLVGNSYMMKTLVDKQGNVLDMSREVDSRPAITVNNNSEAISLTLEQLDSSQIASLEEMLSEDDREYYYIYAQFIDRGENLIYEDVDFIKLTIGDKEFVNNEPDEDDEIITIDGSILSYVSAYKEIYMSNSEDIIMSTGNTRYAINSTDKVVNDFQNEVDGIKETLTKRPLITLALDEPTRVSSNADFYALQPYEYKGVNYSAVMMTVMDWDKYDNAMMYGDGTDADAIYEDSILGYIIVTTDHPTLVSDALNQFVFDNLSTYILAFIFIGLICFVSAYWIVRPIRRIENTAMHIAKREFDYPIDMTRHDELGSLARSIDQMSKELEKTINSLYQEIDKVKQLEGVRKDFVSNFTHEIKTPLGIINGFSELVELEQDETKRNEYIQIIQGETQKINELVMAMLEYSRLESNTITLNLETVSMKPLIQSVLDSMNYIIDRKNIQLDIMLDDVMIEADLFKMEMVMNNFISNALRYVPDNGKVSITLDDHMFTIENEGKPIPQDELDKIWLTFHKVDKARNEEGTGLGLAICQSVLSLHNFEYGVENTSTGIKFYFKY